MKITRFSPVLMTLFLVVLMGCSAGYRLHNDLRAAYDELTDGNLITFDYNFPSSPKDYLVVSDGESVSLPASVVNDSYRKKQDGITMVLESWTEYPDGSGTSYPLGSSLPVTGNATYYAKWTVIGGIGPAGGIVVYDNLVVNNGWRYLEMAVGASADQAGLWNTNIITQRSETLMDIGEGKWNTYKIITQETYDFAIAAEIFNTYSLNTYNDWFLPSIYELQVAEVFLPDATPYWSSTGYINTMNVLVFIKGQSPQSITQGSSDIYGRPFRVFKDEHPTVSVFYSANATDATGDLPYDYNVYKAYDASDEYEDEEAIIVKGQGTLSRPGYTFIGWCAAPGGGLPIATEGSAMYSSEDIILYAQWIPE